MAFVTMQRLSRTAGRALTTIACRTASVVLLVAIGVLTLWMDADGDGVISHAAPMRSSRPSSSNEYCNPP